MASREPGSGPSFGRSRSTSSAGPSWRTTGLMPRGLKMLDPFQQSLFPESISSAEDSPASPSLSRGNAAVTRTTDGCGQRCSGSCERCDPVGWSLRTFLASELSALTQSSKTWKRQATPSGRSWWVLTTSAPRTAGSGSGSWPTATAGDANASGSRNLPGSKAHPGTSLTDATCRWPTPRAEDSESAGAHRTRGTAETLTAATRVWTTPTCRDRETPAKLTRGSGSTASGHQIVEPLGLQVQGSPSTSGSPRVASLVLNPAWVTYLMGFPGDWLHGFADKLFELWETRLSRRSRKRSAARSGK